MKKFLIATAILSVGTLATVNMVLYRENLLAMVPSITGFFMENTDTETENIKIPTNYTFEERMARAQKLEENGYTTLAIQEYLVAAEIDPENSTPYRKIGELTLQNNTYPEAEARFQKALDIQPDDQSALLGLARAQIGQNKFTDAKTIIDGLTTEDAITLYYKGLIASYFDERDASKTALEKILTDTTYGPKAQKIVDAFTAFAQQEEGQLAYLQTLLGRAYNQNEEYQCAIGILTAALQQKSTYRDAWILLGYAQLSINKAFDAIDALKQAEKLDPTKAETSYLLGLAYSKIEKFTEAQDALEKALENGFTPKQDVYQKLAEVSVQGKDYTSAIEYYTKVIAENGETVQNYIRPVWISIEYLKDPATALKYAQDAVQNFPNDAMSWNLLGWAQTAGGLYDEAEGNLKKAIQMNNNLAAAYLNLGWLYEKTDRTEDAKTNYQKAYTLSPHDGIGTLAAQRYNNLLNTPAPPVS